MIKAEGFSERQGRRSRLIPSLLGLTLIVGGAHASAQSAPAGTTPAQTVNAFQEQAGKLGAKRCLGLFSGLGQSATVGATYAVQVQADRTDPNAHTTIGVTGVTYNQPNYKGSAAGVVVAAPVGQGCEGTMVRVAPFPASCHEVVRQLPAGSAIVTNLSGTPLYNLGGNQGQAMLVASGTGCVVVTIAQARRSG